MLISGSAAIVVWMAWVSAMKFAIPWCTRSVNCIVIAGFSARESPSCVPSSWVMPHQSVKKRTKPRSSATSWMVLRAASSRSPKNPCPYCRARAGGSVIGSRAATLRGIRIVKGTSAVPSAVTAPLPSRFSVDSTSTEST